MTSTTLNPDIIKDEKIYLKNNIIEIPINNKAGYKYYIEYLNTLIGFTDIDVDTIEILKSSYVFFMKFKVFYEIEIFPKKFHDKYFMKYSFLNNFIERSDNCICFNRFLHPAEECNICNGNISIIYLNNSWYDSALYTKIFSNLKKYFHLAKNDQKNILNYIKYVLYFRQYVYEINTYFKFFDL